MVWDVFAVDQSFFDHVIQMHQVVSLLWRFFILVFLIPLGKQSRKLEKMERSNFRKATNERRTEEIMKGVNDQKVEEQAGCGLSYRREKGVRAKKAITWRRSSS